MAYFGKISAREHYALRLLLALAKKYKKGTALTLSEISRKEGISLKYLEQLVVPFKRAHWLVSQRGRSGGYRLVKNPNIISLRDIIRLVESDPYVIYCLHGKHGTGCILEGRCPSRKAWLKLQASLNKILQTIKLSKLIK